MTVRRFAVFLAATAVLALPACANGTSAPTASSGSSSAASSAAPVDPAPSTSAPAPESSRIPIQKGSTTLTGVVAAGVEPGCLILNSPDSHHVLIFDDAAMRAEAKVGATVTVTGKAEPTQMTTCQQGVPFIVTAVRAS